MKAKLIILTLTLLSLLFIFWGIREQKNLDLFFGEYVEVKVPTGSKFADIPLREPFKKENYVKEADWDSVDATSIVAFNPLTSKNYFTRNADEKRSVASITKLMTALVALDEYDLDETIILSRGVNIPDRNLALKIGDKVSVSELLEAMLVASKNDAAEILAQEYPEGYSAFIQLMNEKAIFLGMKNSHFSNASGFIDKDNYSTANDLRILVTAVLTSNPLKSFTREKNAVFSYFREGKTLTQSLVSTNELLGVVSNIRGLKTGYTIKSGPSFIGYFVSSDQDQLVTILLNSPDRFTETRQLLRLIQESFKY